MPPINPNMSPGAFIGDQSGSFLSGQQSPPAAQSLLQMLSGGIPQQGVGTGDNPYGGKTLSQIMTSTGPGGSYARFADMPNYGDMPGWNGGGGAGPVNWGDTPATNENVSEAIQHLGQYRPEIAKTLQSSGPEGGFFSIPGISGNEIPWGYYDDPRKENPAPGLMGMSTNNWRLLPKQFQNPNYAMRAGHIIDRYMAQNLGLYLGGTPMGEAVSNQARNIGSGGHGFPVSYGAPFGPRGSFFPGQLEPWTPEGGPGGMGTGVT